MTIRTLGPDHRFSQRSPAALAEKRRAALSQGDSFDILALSSGGAAGAFGAGAVAGLTRSGTRPDFSIVSGVSVGALIAPYAYLGPSWDQRLVDAFASVTTGQLLQPRGLGAIFGSSVYRGAPLKELVATYVSEEMINAVAQEAEKGRLLLVVTTNVVTGQPVFWDLGSIARYGGAGARILFCEILVASASVPGMFPPVILRVQQDDGIHEEAHVDGGTTVPFFVPPVFTTTTPGGAARSSPPSVYVIIDGSLDEPAQRTRLTARAIFSRGVHAGLKHMLLTTLELTAATVQLRGATLHYAAVPSAYPSVNAFYFHADTMRPLFDYAYQCAQTRRLWTTFEHPGNPSATHDSVAPQDVACPVDDALIGYIASR